MSILVNEKVQFIVEGEPASKANTRKLVYVKGKMLFIKSKKDLQYVKEFDIQ